VRYSQIAHYQFDDSASVPGLLQHRRANAIDGCPHVRRRPIIVIHHDLAWGLIAPFASAQDQSVKPKTATIRFVADVNIQTVSSLIEQVEANIRQGINDIKRHHDQ